MANTQATYSERLDGTSATRYAEKLMLIGNTDPYSITRDKLTTDPCALPAVTYPDIVNYLVYSPSPYTLEDLKCFKGLEAYNQFISGWVRDVSACVINDLHVVLGRVMHSQRLRDTPLKPWLIADKQGKILCGHCDCVAGFGETCTHVAALLFYVETKVRIRDSSTVTQEAAYWKLPTTTTNVVYSRACDMDFTSAKTKKRKLDALVNTDETLLDKTPGKKANKVTPEPTNQEMDSLFQNLAAFGSKAAVLSVVPGHSKSFIPSVLSSQYPPVLTDLYDPEYARLPFHELMQVCEKTEVKVSREQCLWC